MSLTRNAPLAKSLDVRKAGTWANAETAKITNKESRTDFFLHGMPPM